MLSRIIGKNLGVGQEKAGGKIGKGKGREEREGGRRGEGREEGEGNWVGRGNWERREHSGEVLVDLVSL